MRPINGLSPREIQDLFGFYMSFKSNKPYRQVDITYCFDNFVIGDGELLINNRKKTFKWGEIRPFFNLKRSSLKKHGIGTLATILPLEKLVEAKELQYCYRYERGDSVSPIRQMHYLKVGIDINSNICLDQYLTRFRRYAAKKGFEF